MLVGALSAHAASANAQSDRAPELREAELSTLRSAVEQARFEDAEARARALLERGDLSARQHNDALELLAVAQVARRDESGAHATLAELFTRDPEHPERLRDPGPSVEAVFARVRAQSRPALEVALTSTALVTDAQGRAFLHVKLGKGRDAVDSVHVFSWVVPEPERSHVVAEVGLREQLTIGLPVPRGPASAGASAPRLELYVEARAPSGAVIGRDGSADGPLAVELSGAPPCPPAPPPPSRVRGPWWLWTSVAIVIAGVSVSGAVLAH